MVLIEIGAVVAVEVRADLRAKEPVDERRGVNKRTIAEHWVLEVRRAQRTLKLCYVVADIRVLRGNDVVFVRIVNTDRHTVARRRKAVAVFEAVDLEQVATRDIAVVGQRQVLFDDVDTMRPYIHMVAQLVATQKRPVQHQVDKLIAWVELQRRELAQSRCHRVPDQRFVGSIRQQRPLLCLRITLAQQLFFLMKLQFVRLLLQIPRRIAATAYLERVVNRQLIRFVHIAHRGIDIRRLARNRSPPIRVNVDGGQIRHTSPLRMHTLKCERKER